MVTAASSPPVHSPRRPGSALPTVVALGVALSTLFKMQGFDVWWHVRTGRWIFENQAIPTVDPFSFTAAGPWASSGALAQLYFFACDALAGAEGLVWGKVLLVAVLGALVVRLAAQASGGFAACVVALWGLASGFRFVVRPHMFSFIAFASLLLLLRRAEQRNEPRTLWWIPLLVAIACNFHRGGTLALPVLAIACTAWAVKPATRRLAGHAACVLLASTFASLLNQGGLHTLTSSFAVSASPVFAQTISEWHALTPSLLISYFPWFGVVTALWAVAAWQRGKLDLEVAIVGFALVLGVSKVRFLPYPVLAMVPGLAYGASVLAASLSERASGVVRPRLLHAGLAVLALCGLTARYATTSAVPAWGPGVAEWRVPVAAADFLEAHPPPGRMWHDFELGGYLLYRLAPETKQVFIDGRNDKVYSPEFFERTVAAMHDPARLREQLETWDIGFTVTTHAGPGDTRHRELYQDPDWQLVYWDDWFVVMVKRTPESEAYLAEHGYQELRVADAFDRLSHPASDPRGRVLAREVLRNQRQAPDSARAHYMAAMVFRTEGREDAYQTARERVRRIATSRELAIALP